MFDKQILALPGSLRALGACVAWSLVTAALIIGQAVFLSLAIVRIWEGEPFGDQIPFVLGFAACFILRAVAQSAQESGSEAFAHSSVGALRHRIVGVLYDTGATMPREFGSGAVVTNLIEGCSKAETYVSRVLPKTVSLILVPLIICIAIFTQDIISGIIVLVCYPFIVAFMRLIGYTASDESAKRHEGFVEMSNHFMDSLRGMGTLKAFGISKAYSKAVYAASELYRKMVMRTLRIAQLSGAVLDVFATCGLAAVAIMLGFRMVEGSIAFLPALIVLMLVPEYFMPIKAYASDYHASLDGSSALSSLMAMECCRRDRIRASSVDIAVPEGAHIALIGASGSGKTSLLDVMAGYAELLAGNVALCGVSGDALRADSWRKRVAYVPQHPYVLAGSLRSNVALYAPEASDERILDALGLVGLSALVESLPDGLDSIIGPTGRSLSGGEAHRVALARAIVGDRDLWLLDEPGASLDEETEAELVEAIVPLMDGRTVVIATHKECWLPYAGEVIDVSALTEVTHG